MLNELEKLPIEIIQDFRQKRASQAIGKALQEYILQLDRCAELHQAEGNINRAAKKLQEDWPELAFQTARSRVYDAINHFHLNNTVKEEAWNNFYADRLENLAKLNIANDDLREARLNYQKAHEYRINASRQTIDPDLLKPIEHEISADIDPERLGLTEKSLKKMWVESNEFIDDLPVDDSTKNNLKKEAKQALGRFADDDEEADYEQLD